MHKLEQKNYAQKVFITACVASVIFVAFYVLYLGADVFLLLFSGILFSVFLKGAGAWVQSNTRLSKLHSVLTVLIILVLFCVVIFQWCIPRIGLQIEDLIQSLIKSFKTVSAAVAKIPWLTKFVRAAGTQYLIPTGNAVLGKTTPFISNIIGGVAGFFAALVIGLYLAFDTETYLNGLLRLFPLQKRPRIRAFLEEAGSRLHGWILGQIVAMVSIGAFTTIGLFVLKVPLALILGLISGMLAFIPVAGLILSVVPALLLTFAQEPHLMIYVAALYVGAHFLEAYFLTSWIQFRAVALPPILVIFPQILSSLMFGFMGLVLATPLTVVAIVFVKFFYVEDVLEDYGTSAHPTGKNQVPAV